MRKILLTILIAMVASGGLVGKVEAKYEEDGAMWWSVEELLTKKQEYEAKLIEECSDDEKCRRQKLIEWSSDKEFQVVRIFAQKHFFVTEIDPGRDAVKVLYLDKKSPLTEIGSDRVVLEFIFIAWFEESKGEVLNYNHRLPIEGQFSMEPQVLYAQWMRMKIPTGKEYDLPIAKTNLTLNESRILEYAVFGGGYNVKGGVQYGVCVNRADYTKWEKCRMMISAEKGVSYLPVRENVVELEVEPEVVEPEEPGDEPEVEPEEPGDEPEVVEPEVIEPEEFIQPDEPVVTEEPKMIEPEVVALENKPAVLEPVNLIASVARPAITTREITNNQEKTDENLGLYTNISDNGGDDLIEVPDLMAGCAKEKIVEFSWWLILLLILGDALIMWWFWPDREKEHGKK